MTRKHNQPVFQNDYSSNISAKAKKKKKKGKTLNRTETVIWSQGWVNTRWEFLTMLATVWTRWKTKYTDADQWDLLFSPLPFSNLLKGSVCTIWWHLCEAADYNIIQYFSSHSCPVVTTKCGIKKKGGGPSVEPAFVLSALLWRTPWYWTHPLHTYERLILR